MWRFFDRPAPRQPVAVTGGYGLTCGGDGEVQVGVVCGHVNVNVNVGVEHNGANINGGVLPDGEYFSARVPHGITPVAFSVPCDYGNIYIGLPRGGAANDAALGTRVAGPRAGGSS